MGQCGHWINVSLFLPPGAGLRILILVLLFMYALYLVPFPLYTPVLIPVLIKISFPPSLSSKSMVLVLVLLDFKVSYDTINYTIFFFETVISLGFQK